MKRGLDRRMMASQIVVVERVARRFRPPRTPARSRVGDIVRWNRSYPKLTEIRPQPDAHVFSPSLLRSAPNVCENIAFVERFSFHGASLSPSQVGFAEFDETREAKTTV